MGNCHCPCWPKKPSNYDPYVDDDDDYAEYDSPTRAPHRYRTLEADPEPTSRTNNYTHTNRPPDNSTYVPPPIPQSQPTQSRDSQRLSWNKNSPNTSNNSSTPNTTTTTTTTTTTSTSSTGSSQQQQYTQYSESAYLARLPEQPTDSMLLDSMMKSSFLTNHPHYPPTNNTNHYSVSSSSSSSSSQLPPYSSNIVDSGAFDANSLVDSNYEATSSLSHNHTDMDASVMSRSPDMARSDISVGSSASSIYYDAAGAASYMMSSANEGAFENPSEPQ